MEARVEASARTSAGWIASDQGATWAFRLAVLGAAAVYAVIGRHQWFTRDDWASLVTREAIFKARGWQHWLLDPQDGHWLTVPVLVYHFLAKTVGVGSYWPFLVPAMALHVVAVLLVRVLCRRHGVSAWTTTLVCTGLLVFGSGWENIVFAIQISYNVSLVAFLAQVVLTDHDGPVDRRDYVAAGLTLLGVMSSGFGPIFMVGIFVVLVLRRRWKALLVAIVPQALLYAWWFVAWESDLASERRPGNESQLPAFVVRGVSSTFDALTRLPGLAGIALVATLGVALTARFGLRTRSTFLGLTATVLVMFVAIGKERVGFGVDFASSSRYSHVGAIVIAPVFALAVDQLARISREARWAGLVVLAAAAALNLGTLRELSSDWAVLSQNERRTFELIAGSGLVAQADPQRIIFVESPDIAAASIPVLVQIGAIVPVVPVTAEDIVRVRTALGLPAAP